jgi:hypothetical protein
LRISARRWQRGWICHPVATADPSDPWMAHMRRGDFAAAWRICDEVLQRRRAASENCSSWPRHLQFVWDGEPLDGKRVLVRCYHGLGDTIQFVRLLAMLRPRVAEITLWCQPQLVELLRTVRGADRVLTLHAGEPDVDYDSDVELMELPHVLRLTLDDIPRNVPYLKAGHSSLPSGPGFSPPHEMRNGPLSCGLVWRAGDWFPQRSLPDEALALLGDVEGVRWCSLQYPAQGLPFASVDLACADVCEMAKRMQQLDLIISVDTMAAHLAGALALPVWTLLHEDCDWRWLAQRDDSPWYPTMQLFRQPPDGGWESVIDRLREALRAPQGVAARSCTRVLDHRTCDGRWPPESHARSAGRRAP